MKTLTTAASIALLATSAWADNWTCNPKVSNRDKDPVLATRVVVDETPGGAYPFNFAVGHLLLSGEVKVRFDQYRDVNIRRRVLGGGYEIIWNGVFRKDPRTQIVGKFTVGDGSAEYTESWFTDGRFDHSETMQCDSETVRSAQPWIDRAPVVARGRGCTVDDPTGTPLNVRASPNGPILGALNNGTSVEVRDVTVDRSGRRWAYILPLSEGKRGWAFREYLDCD